VLQWNPDVATQLVVASDDDRSPTLQMWDLRNSMSPVKEFVGHTKVCQRGSWWLRAPQLRLARSSSSSLASSSSSSSSSSVFYMHWCPLSIILFHKSGACAQQNSSLV
jgi:hypothetical protein